MSNEWALVGWAIIISIAGVCMFHQEVIKKNPNILHLILSATSFTISYFIVEAVLFGRREIELINGKINIFPIIIPFFLFVILTITLGLIISNKIEKNNIKKAL